MPDELAVIPGPTSADGRIESCVRATDESGVLKLSVEVRHLDTRRLRVRSGFTNRDQPRSWSYLRTLLLAGLGTMFGDDLPDCPPDFTARLDRDLRRAIAPWLTGD